MSPPRGRVTPIGRALRGARQGLGIGQRALGEAVGVSARQISRWENGHRPPEHAAFRLLTAVSEGRPDLHDALAAALDIEVEVQIVPAKPAAPALPRPSPADLRASLDAIIYAAAEQRDVLPRHLRAFGIELLQGADRLGLTAKDAAALVAVPERTKPSDPAG